MNQLLERNQSLWLMIAGPVIWAAHFLLSYVTASIWCAKTAGPGGSLLTVRWAIGGLTVLALAGLGASIWDGYRRYSYGAATLPHDGDTPEDRHRFLGFATLLLSLLSAVATIYSALAAVFITNC
jgi:hypothetical protein